MNIIPKKGFTLIEVLISLFLFVIISISMMDIIDQTTASQKKLDSIIQKNRRLENTIYVIRKDLQMAYSQTNVKNWIRHRYKNHLESYGESSYFSEFLDAQDQAYFEEYIFERTGLMGEKEFVFFTSASSSIAEGGAPIAKIGYKLQDCPAEKDAGQRCLLRQTSLIHNNTLNELDSDSLKETILLKNVENFEIQYWNQEAKDWKSFARETSLKGMFFPHTFPMAVQILLKWQGQSFSMAFPVDLAFLSAEVFTQSSISFEHELTKIKTPSEKPPSTKPKEPADAP